MRCNLQMMMAGIRRAIGICGLAMGVALWTTVSSARGAGSESSPEGGDALALLEMHCVKCHGGEKTKGGLDLTTRERLMRGGESGAAVVAGKADASLLVQSIRHETDPAMPHKAEKLPEAAIGKIAAWVGAGALYNRPLKVLGTDNGPKVGFVLTEADRNHWAFRPIKRIEAPRVDGADAVRNPIDQFILAKLAAKGLSFSPGASRELLIRRVTFDLIGLPPTPGEIDEFVKDASPDAYEKLIDRLLASTHYGERWGRHWLDLARFAESDGFEHDAVRPHAWRYRDWVIKSFNEDKPYDRFIREQIAGDELWPGEPAALIATGFNLLGPDMVDSSDQVQRRHNTLNDMTDTAGLVFLGLTIGCARCHDHKFEPISQKDYYKLQAHFAPGVFRRDLPVPTAAEQKAFNEASSRFNDHPAVKELAALEAPMRERLRKQKIEKLSAEAQMAHNTPAEQRNAEQANLVLETEAMVSITDKELGDSFDGNDKPRRDELIAQIRKLSKLPPLPMAMALAAANGPAAKTFVLNRGEYSQPGEEVRPGWPEVLESAGTAESTDSVRRRSRLAAWITDPRNPLTARVMVNRIWQQHFGRGLVATASDFGTHGQKPTHPELLDWLASEFVRQGWSIKRMHKLMLMSGTYQQASSARKDTATAMKADAENRLYWRMNRLRLEGEAIRDGLLAISGRLNRQMGGPGVFPPIPEVALKGAPGWTVSKDARQHNRRSIYIFARRNLRFPFLEVFDAPDNNLSCPRRERSTTAPQSLTLLNADEVMAAAKATEKRLMKEAGSEDERIVLACKLALGREPSEEEIPLAREFLKQSPLSEFCRALFNLNDFVYLD